MNENANEHKIWLSETDSARLSYIKEKITSIVHSTVMAPPRWFQFDNKKNIVEDFLKKLIPSNAFQKLSETERFFLLASAWIHSIGMIRGIDINDGLLSDEDILKDVSIRTERFVNESYEKLGLEENEAVVIGLLTRFARKTSPMADLPEFYMYMDKTIRVRLLASYLRLAIALDVKNFGQILIVRKEFVNIYPRLILWLGFKLVTGINIVPNEHKIVIQFKYTKRLRTQLQEIYETASRHFSEVLGSVKDIFIKYDITYFLEIAFNYCEVYMKKNAQDEIERFVDWLNMGRMKLYLNYQNPLLVKQLHILFYNVDTMYSEVCSKFEINNKSTLFENNVRIGKIETGNSITIEFLEGVKIFGILALLANVLLNCSKKAVEMRDKWYEGSEKKYRALKTKQEFKTAGEEIDGRGKQLEEYKNVEIELSQDSRRIIEKHAEEILNNLNRSPNITYVKINGIVIIDKESSEP